VNRVIRIPESPRLRRRLKWVAIAGSLVVAGILVAVLMPGKSPSNGTTTGHRVPAQLAVNTHQKLSQADRRRIDTLLDRFIPAAVERRDPSAAWALAGPELRSASSLSAFRAGNLPVPSYPANEQNYHHWRAIDVERGSVVLNILVHPRDPRTLGTWVFSVQVVRSGGRWLVNRIYTIAVMNPPTRPKTVTHELGPADYATPGGAPRNHSTGTPGGHSLLIPVVAIFALVLLVPLTLGGIALVRGRRFRRAAAARGSSELPPLPATYREEHEEHEKMASHS
jgi:hypothetical protein